ncbi:WXG100 family type VII secretion target [Spirillospora sp. NPDC127200]
MSYTRVNFPGMQAAQASFAKAHSEYMATINELDAKIRATLADWEGDADEAYKVMQKQWQAAGAELAAVVRNMSTALGDSHDGYRTTENRNASMFGG